MKRPTPIRTQQAAQTMGENLRTWRKLRGITAQEMADKAAVSADTISRLENGDPSIALHTFLNVCNALGITERIEEATDPYETDYGRARADQALPQRVRR